MRFPPVLLATSSGLLLGGVLLCMLLCPQREGKNREYDTTDELFDQAARLEKRGRYIEALAALDKVLERDPGDSYAYLNRGNIYLRMGNVVAAEADYERSVALRGDDHESRLQLGMVLLKRGEVDRAMEELVLSILYDNHHCGLVHARYARALRAKGLIGEAIREYEIAKARTPENATIYEDLGGIYESLGERARARREYAAGALRSSLGRGKLRLAWRFLGLHASPFRWKTPGPAATHLEETGGKDP